MSFPESNLICFDDDPRIPFQRHRRLRLRKRHSPVVGVADIQDDRRIRNETTEMKQQVTSIEQSKRLIELGVPAEMVSMIWFPEYKIGDNKLPIYPAGTYELVMKYKSYGDMEDKVIPAFTVADLIIMLPAICGDFIIGLGEVEKNNKFIFYEVSEYVIGKGFECAKTVYFFENSLVESCVEAIEWVISNNYKLNI